jgi:hypothetical protein
VSEYLHVCCRELHSWLREGSSDKDYMTYLNGYLHSVLNEFLFNLVLAFGYYEQDLSSSILKTFSDDDEFMGEVENVLSDFKDLII